MGRSGRGPVAILAVEGDDLEWLADGERQLRYQAFQSFLNALTEPVQILFRSQEIDEASLLRPWRSQSTILGLIRRELYDDYRQLLHALTEEHRVMDRRLYLIIREPKRVPGFTRPMAAVRERANHLGNEIAGLGLGSVRLLEEHETARLRWEMVHPFRRWLEARRESPVGFWEHQPIPITWKEEPGRVHFGSGVKAFLYLPGFPAEIQERPLGKLISAPFDLDISWHLSPISTAWAVDFLTKRIRDLRGSQLQARARGLLDDYRLPRVLSDSEQMRDELASGTTRLLKMSLYFGVPGRTIQEAEEKMRLVESWLTEDLLYVERAYFQQGLVLRATLPTGQDSMAASHMLTSQGCSFFYPFGDAEAVDPNKILYGINPKRNSPVFLDRMQDLANPGAFYLGTPGSGKSTLAKVELWRLVRLAAVRGVVVDPEGEYESLGQALGGTILRLYPGSPDNVNCLDLSNPNANQDEIAAKAAFLVGLLDELIGPLDARGRAIADAAYRQMVVVGIENTLSEYQHFLAASPGGSEMAAALAYYVNGTFDLFSHPTNVSLTGPLVIISLRGLPDRSLPLVLPLLLEFIWAQINQAAEPTLVTIDEAHLLMAHALGRRFSLELFKRARKRRALVTAVTQNVGDFLAYDEGRRLLANADLHVLFRQSPADLEEVSHTFRLSSQQRELVSRSPPGEALVLSGQRRFSLQVVLSAVERSLVATGGKSPEMVGP